LKLNTVLTIIAKSSVNYTTDFSIFKAVTVDSANNIICVGQTTQTGYQALLLKFDSALNATHHFKYNGGDSTIFNSVTTDSLNNIICAGEDDPLDSSHAKALVVKFNSDITTAVASIGGRTVQETFFGVTTDSNDNIICVGRTSSTNNDSLIMKFSQTIPSGVFIPSTFTDFVLASITLSQTGSSLYLDPPTSLVIVEESSTLANSTLTLTDATLVLTKGAIYK